MRYWYNTTFIIIQKIIVRTIKLQLQTFEAVAAIRGQTIHHDGMMTLWIRFHQFCLSHGPAALYQSQSALLNGFTCAMIPQRQKLKRAITEHFLKGACKDDTILFERFIFYPF